MASCKDCVHADMCRFYTEELAKAKGITLGKDIFEYFSSGDVCDHFKDRSRFVELPCKVGDAVYKICPVEEGEECNNCPWEYCECYDIGFIKDRHNSIRKGMIHNLVWLIKRMPYFGKIYFTNYENAEKALKERESNA